MLFQENSPPIFKKLVKETLPVAFFKKSHGFIKITPGKYLTPREFAQVENFSKKLNFVLSEVDNIVTANDQRLSAAYLRLKELEKIIDKILYEKLGKEFCSSCEWHSAGSGRELTFMLLEHYIGNALVNYCLLAKRFIKKNEAVSEKQLAVSELEILLENMKYYMSIKQRDFAGEIAAQKASAKTPIFSVAGWAK